MQTSGLFTIHQHTVTLNSISETVPLFIFGDVHRDSPSHALTTWRESLARGKKLKNAIFLGMGDYLDATSTSERECLGHITPKMHDTFKHDINELKRAKVEMFAKEIDFMRGRLVGLINGNHYYDFSSGINSDQMLCEALGAKYLGVCSFIRLTLQYHSTRVNVDIFAHHGKGASRLTGGSLNRVAQMVENVEADILVMGHDHKKGAVPTSPRLYLEHNSKTGLVVKHRDVWSVRSGSYLASYTNGEVNYNVDACRGPSSLGHVEMLLSLKRNQTGGKDTMRVNIQALV
jgi:hypothetical protein